MAGAWAVSLGLAFFAGNWAANYFSDKDRNGIKSNSGYENQAALERHLLIRQLTGKEPDSASSDQSQSFTSPVREALAAALANGNANFRSHAIAVLLSGLALGDIGEAVRFTEGIPAGVRRDEMYSALLRRWGELDGRSALAYALERPTAGNRHEGIVGVLTGWATYDSETAFAWALANPGDNPFQSDTLNAVIGQLAVLDPAKAFSYASELSRDAFQTGALKTLADQLHSMGNLNLALTWYADLKEGSVKELALEHVARIWSSYEPIYASEWIESISGQVVREHAIEAVASTWGRTDPQRAASWAAALPEGRARASGTSAAIGTWLQRGEVNLVARWLNQLPPHQDFDDAVRQVALASMQEDPETAMSWADSIIDENLRSVTMNMVGQRWVGMDPLAAQDFYNTSGNSDPTETYVIEDAGLQIFQGELPQEEIPFEPANNESIPGEGDQLYPEGGGEVVEGDFPIETPEGP